MKIDEYRIRNAEVGMRNAEGGMREAEDRTRPVRTKRSQFIPLNRFVFCLTGTIKTIKMN